MSDVTAPLMVGTVVVVGAGTVLTEHSVNMKAVMAGGVVALGLSAIDNVDERIAELLAGLIFLTACYKFLPPIVDALGFTGGKSGNDVDMSAAKARPGSAQNASAGRGAGVTVPVVQTVPYSPNVPYSTATPQLGGGATAPQEGGIWI